jgi:hypothetical protein
MDGWKRADTDWFMNARWGVFFHYLVEAYVEPDKRETAEGIEAWNRVVDSFDVKGLARQLEDAGAGYLMLALGQNSGYFCSPNATYDRLVGRAPSRLARRDVVGDLADALTGVGVRLMVYLPSMAPFRDPQAVRGLRCTPPWDVGFPPASTFPGDSRRTDERLTEFQRNWEAVIREWSLRWGRAVHGWWIDGCYDTAAAHMYRHPDAPNFRSFAEATKAGNPDSLVAFNSGVRVPVISTTEFDDYTAGEIAGDLPLGRWGGPGANPAFCDYSPIQRWVNGAQYHILGFLGPWWLQSPPRFPTELVVGYTRYVNAHEGVVTWDVPPSSDGLIPEPFLAQLRPLHGVRE